MHQTSGCNEASIFSNVLRTIFSCPSTSKTNNSGFLSTYFSNKVAKLSVLTSYSLKVHFLFINSCFIFTHIFYSFIFLLILLVQILNSYLIYLLDNFNSFKLLYFYSINFIFLISTFFLINKILK